MLIIYLALPSIFIIIWIVLFILLGQRKKNNLSIQSAVLIFLLSSLSILGSIIILSPIQHWIGAIGNLVWGGAYSLFFFINSLIIFGILRFRRNIITLYDVLAIMGINAAAPIMATLFALFFVFFTSSLGITGLALLLMTFLSIIQSIFLVVWFKTRDRQLISYLVVSPVVVTISIFLILFMLIK